MKSEFESKELFEQARKFAFEYNDEVFERNVAPTPAALADLKQFEETLPENTQSGKQILEQLHQYGSPNTLTMTGGRYFGFVNGSIIPTALAAKWLADFWDQNYALYVMSPIVAKLETICESWLKELFGLPRETVAGFVSGTSMANVCGLAAARYHLLKKQNWDVNEQGIFGAPKIRVVLGEHAHSSVIKALTMLGFGKNMLEWVPVDEQGRMDPQYLPKLDNNTLLILQAGNVNSGAFDPFETLCAKANAADSWVHIDGAFGLWAAGSKNYQHLTKGIEKADSWSVDAHKTLNAPYDSGIILCKNQKALTTALHSAASYIQYSDHRDGMMYVPEMSKRARAVELWAALKYLGKQGIDELVDGLCDRAQQFGKELQKEGFQVLNDVVFNQVLVAGENDAETQRILANIQASGECWCGGATWFGKAVIRISVCSWVTSPEDVSRSVRAFVNARKSLAS